MDDSGNLKQVTLRGSSASKIQESLAKECRGTAKRKAIGNIPSGTFSEHMCSQDGTTHKGTTKQLEANYELILALVTTLNKHLRKREVIGPESKDLAIKCLDEVIRICEVCIRKETRRRDSVGTMIVGPLKTKQKGEGMAQGRNLAIIERYHGHSTKSGQLEIGVNSGEGPNNDTSLRVIHTLNNSALSQLKLFGENMDYPAGLQQRSLPCCLTRLQRQDTRHPLLPENTNIFLSPTPSDLLSHPASQKTIQMTEVCPP